MLYKIFKLGSYVIITQLFFFCDQINDYSYHIDDNFVVKKDSFIKTKLILFNNTSNDIIIDKISTSCNCLILESNKKIRLKQTDTIEVKIFGEYLGKQKEDIILTTGKTFKKISIDYEVKNF